MKRPYLIQRLGKPFKKETKLTKLVNTFSFGGGLLTGGFPQKVFNEINKIFRFDYMGSAEFEWGEVPRSFNRILEAKRRKEIIASKKYIAEYNKTIYIICNRIDEIDVERFLEVLIKQGDYGKGIFLKEPTFLKRELERKEQTYSSINGWIDIENDFMFFLDKEMFENTLRIFGLELEEAKAKEHKIDLEDVE